MGAVLRRWDWAFVPMHRGIISLVAADARRLPGAAGDVHWNFPVSLGGREALEGILGLCVFLRGRLYQADVSVGSHCVLSGCVGGRAAARAALGLAAGGGRGSRILARHGLDEGRIRASSDFV